jgi:DNA-binding NtrC family response regulator
LAAEGASGLAAPRVIEAEASPSLNTDDLLGLPLAEVERIVITAMLERHQGSVPRAARILDISPSTLYRKLAAWGLDKGT